MTDGSRILVDQRHRRTMLIITLIVIGVCLFVIAAWLSLFVPIAVEEDSRLMEGLYWPA